MLEELDALGEVVDTDSFVDSVHGLALKKIDGIRIDPVRRNAAPPEEARVVGLLVQNLSADGRIAERAFRLACEQREQRRLVGGHRHRSLLVYDFADPRAGRRDSFPEPLDARVRVRIW